MSCAIDELLILVENIERRLSSDVAGAERNQIGEILRYIEKRSEDGSVVALANQVAIALSQRSLEGPFGVVAVVRALAALDRLRCKLKGMREPEMATSLE